MQVDSQQTHTHNNYQNGQAHSHQHTQQKHHNPEASRAQGEDLAGKKKKGFSFIQKAGLVGAAITAGLFFVKSKILTFLSFLTALPTAGLLYFGFFTGKKDKAQAQETQTKPDIHQAPQGPSPEVEKQLHMIAAMQNEIKDNDFKNFIENTLKAANLSRNLDAQDVSKAMRENLGYKIDKETHKKLAKKLHPDMIANQPPEKQIILRALFRIMQDNYDESKKATENQSKAA